MLRRQQLELELGVFIEVAIIGVLTSRMCGRRHPLKQHLPVIRNVWQRGGSSDAYGVAGGESKERGLPPLLLPPWPPRFGLRRNLASTGTNVHRGSDFVLAVNGVLKALSLRDVLTGSTAYADRVGNRDVSDTSRS